MCGMFHRSHGFGFGSIECCIELCRGSGPGIFMMMRSKSERLATTVLMKQFLHILTDFNGINVTLKFKGCKLLVVGGADRSGGI